MIDLMRSRNLTMVHPIQSHPSTTQHPSVDDFILFTIFCEGQHLQTPLKLASLSLQHIMKAAHPPEKVPSSFHPNPIPIIIISVSPLTKLTILCKWNNRKLFRPQVVEITLPEEFPTLSEGVDCLPYIPCRGGAAIECMSTKLPI